MYWVSMTSDGVSLDLYLVLKERIVRWYVMKRFAVTGRQHYTHDWKGKWIVELQVAGRGRWDF